MKNEALLIDIDGTICDSSIAMNYLNGNKDRNNFEVYYRLLDLVKPHQEVIDSIINNCRSKNTKGFYDGFKDITLVFLTGRNAERHVMQYTLEFVEEAFKLPLRNSNVKADFYFRPINNHVNTTEYKTQKFQMLKTLYDFTHIYEDEPKNVQMFSDLKQESCLVHWVKNSYNYSLELMEEPITVPKGVHIHLI